MAHLSNITFWFARLSIGLVGGLILLATFFLTWAPPEGEAVWSVSRSMAFLVGFSLLLAALVLFIRPLQVWLMRSFAFRAMSPNSMILLSLSQAVLFCAGVSVCVLVLAADWLGLDPTPGFGKVRALQLAAGLSLLLATYLLHSKPLQRIFTHLFGDYYVNHVQLILLSGVRWLLLIAGLVTTFLVSMADALGIDPTPGWGEDRIIQLFTGLSLIAASFVIQNHTMKAWFLRTSGFRLLSPVQISVLLIFRGLSLVAGVTITGLVVFADVLGIDPTPGWGLTRMMQLAAGLALILASFVLHKRKVWKRIRRNAEKPKA